MQDIRGEAPDVQKKREREEKRKKERKREMERKNKCRLKFSVCFLYAFHTKPGILDSSPGYPGSGTNEVGRKFFSAGLMSSLSCGPTYNTDGRRDVPWRHVEFVQKTWGMC